VLTGLGMIAGYALLGSTWLILKTEGALQDWAYRITPRLLIMVVAVFIIISIWTPMMDPMVKSRWFDQLSLIWLLPVGALISMAILVRALLKRQEALPFVATMGIFIFTYLGLAASKLPYIVPPNYTLWDAASAGESQLFLLIGLLFVIPFVLMYTAWTYWVFRGKVKAGMGYH
jgi:cytochrome d ubiquinol oxidase subunit II